MRLLLLCLVVGTGFACAAPSEGVPGSGDPEGRMGTPEAPKASPTPAPGGPRLIVMPFEDRTGDPGSAKRADQATQRVFTRLVESGRFRVLDRATVMRLLDEAKLGAAPDPAVAARLTGADYVVIGALTSVGVRTEASGSDRTLLAEARVRLTIIRNAPGEVVYSDEGIGTASRTASGGARMSFDPLLAADAINAAADLVTGAALAVVTK